jgi:hypothetical protein
MRPWFQITQHKKRVGGMAQVVEHLSRRDEALSSNPSIAPPKTENNSYIQGLVPTAEVITGGTFGW